MQMHATNHIVLQRFNSGNNVTVFLVGAGGTGSQMLTGLARLDRALRALGGGGLNVHVWDDDTVSSANVGRQLFYDADIGLNKAITLVNRVNLCFGLRWVAHPERFSPESVAKTFFDRAHFVIGAVDSKKSRQEVKSVLRTSLRANYWLDLGNGTHQAQVVLGEPLNDVYRDWHMRLPDVTELFPQMLEADAEDDDVPSCSLAEALEKQELFINQAVSTAALDMMWRLFRHGGIDHSVRFINLEFGSMHPLPIDRDVWKRMGHKTARKPPERKPKASA